MFTPTRTVRHRYDVVSFARNAGQRERARLTGFHSPIMVAPTWDAT